MGKTVIVFARIKAAPLPSVPGHAAVALWTEAMCLGFVEAAHARFTQGQGLERRWQCLRVMDWFRPKVGAARLAA